MLWTFCYLTFTLAGIAAVAALSTGTLDEFGGSIVEDDDLEMMHNFRDRSRTLVLALVAMNAVAHICLLVESVVKHASRLSIIARSGAMDDMLIKKLAENGIALNDAGTVADIRKYNDLLATQGC